MKVIWPLLDPALLLGLLLGAATVAAWLRRPRPRLLRGLLTGALALLALLTLPPLPEWITRALVLPEGGQSPPPGAAEVLVVLGGGMDGQGALSSSSYLRTAAAVPLWRRGVGRVLLFSGVEAGPMAALARQLGVPDAALLVEPRAQSTWENARFSHALLLARSPDRLPRIAVVTSPDHCRRAVRAFRAVGFEAVPAPVPYPLRPNTPSPWPSFRRAALLAGSLYELSAGLAYDWRGWQAEVTAGAGAR